MEKKEVEKEIKKRGVWRVLKMYNVLCPKCRTKNVLWVKRGHPERAYDDCCPECKQRLEKIWES